MSFKRPFKELKPPFSIFSKLLVWFFLNLLLITLLLVVIFQLRFHFAPGSPLAGRALHNTASLRFLLIHEIKNSSRDKWNEILERYSGAFKMRLHLVTSEGRVLAGMSDRIPEDVMQKLKEKIKQRVHFFQNRPICETFHDKEKKNLCKLHPPGLGLRERFIPIHFKSYSPEIHWLAMPLPGVRNSFRSFGQVVLLASTDDPFGSGIYPDPLPWIAAVVLVIVISVVWWVPMVRHLTRPLHSMVKATEEISRGKFNVSVDSERSDETGVLASSIVYMASRLENFIKGRQRFLADVAHELCSPLARLRMGLGILENSIDDKKKIENVSEEIDNMSELINELLSFSMAEFNPDSLQLSAVNIRDLISKVVEREKGVIDIRIFHVDNKVHVMAREELLTRAVSNLLRNAERYAGEAGPVSIKTVKKEGFIFIKVEDSGNGVPESELENLFDPFFRLEPDRGRDSGGAGLGLAIVKTCVEACQGSVRAYNIKTGDKTKRVSGLGVEIKLMEASTNKKNRQ